MNRPQCFICAIGATIAIVLSVVLLGPPILNADLPSETVKIIMLFLGATFLWTVTCYIIFEAWDDEVLIDESTVI